MGMTVTHEFEVVEVDRSRITFAVTVRDTLEECARKLNRRSGG